MGGPKVDASAPSTVSLGTLSKSAELGEVKICLKACRRVECTLCRKMMSNLYQENVLEEPLHWIFRIVVLVFVKKVRPTVSGNGVIRMVVPDVGSMPVVTTQMSECNMHRNEQTY